MRVHVYISGLKFIRQHFMKRAYIGLFKKKKKKDLAWVLYAAYTS
jgi:hypothetical protein